MKYKISFLLFFIFIGYQCLQAQKRHLSFEHITIENGMSSNHINSFVRDKKGYLWIASGNGLNRYDGYEVKIFLPDPKDSNAIVGKNIFTVAEDDEGNIWVATDSALNKYVAREEKFYHYFTGKDTALGVGIGRMLYDQRTGSIWATNGKNSVMKFNPKTNNCHVFKHDPKDPNSIGPGGIMSFCQDENGDIWHVTWDHGISKYNVDQDNFTHYLHDPKDPNSIFGGPVFSIVSDKNGGIWAGTFMPEDDHIAAGRLDLKTGKFTNFKFGPKDIPRQVFSLCQDLNGDIWFASIYQGLAVYDQKTKSFTSYKHNINETESLNENFVISIYVDYENNLWVGSINKGVNKADLKSNDVYYYQFPVKNEAERENMKLYDLCEDDLGNIWTTNSYAVFKMQTKSGKLSRVQFKLRDNEYGITHLVNGHDGTVWAMTDSSIYQVNIATKKTERYINKNLPSNIINGIFIDRYKNKYIFCANELLVYPEGNLNKSPLKLFQINRKGFSRSEFTLEGDMLWVRMDDSFIKVNTKTFEVNNFFPEIRNKMNDFSYPVDIYKDKNNFYIHTSKGIFRYNLDSNSFIKKRYNFLRNDEMTPISIRFSPEDVCFTTFRGIFIYNLKTKHYLNPKLFNHDKINPDAMIRSSTGKFYLGAGYGFISFDPNTVKNQIFPKPKIVIEYLYLFNKNVKINSENSPISESISDAKELVLKHDQSVFSFEMTLLTLDEVNKNTYSYMLEGFEKSWNNIGPRKVATYTSLPAGEYVFKYRGKDKNGTLSDVGSLKITILPPFWETWWFRLLVASIIAGVIYLLFMLRVREINKQKIELEHQVILRTAEILSQKEEIMAQKEAIEFHEQKISELYKDVTDSIQTAQRIQEGILPPNDLLKDKMTDSFILYQPKDIVSGDFYWFYTEKDRYYIAAIDCTGHGVAGAFMSLIAYNLLNLIVKEDKGLTPDKLLEKLNRYIINVLHQESENSISKDGMDASVCMVDTKKNQLHFAGANNALYLIRNGVIEITKADSNSVGIQPNNKVSHFTDHVFDIRSGDCFYLFSDGFASQFGGLTGNEKMKYQRFRDALLANHSQPMAQQKVLLNQYLTNWMSNAQEQTDDIMVIGFKL